jgi:hypothetical protein
MSIATCAELTYDTFADFVRRLRHHVRGEGVSWHGTADPLFTVQARRIIYGIDRDYTDKVAVCVDDSSWFSPQEYWDDADEDMRARLDACALDTDDGTFLEMDERDQWDALAELDDHTVTGWDETWEYVNSHFTKEAAEAFIARKKHDYRHGLRVYVDAQVYCWEFNAIIKGLLDGQIVFDSADRIAALERQLELEKIERETFQHGLHLAERQNAELRQQLAASADKTAATGQPVAKVRVRNKGYGMELSEYVAYALPEGMHDLYAAPQPQAAQSEDSRDAAKPGSAKELVCIHAALNRHYPRASIDQRQAFETGWAECRAALAQAGKEGA